MRCRRGVREMPRRQRSLALAVLRSKEQKECYFWLFIKRKQFIVSILNKYLRASAIYHERANLRVNFCRIPLLPFLTGTNHDTRQQSASSQ